MLCQLACNLIINWDTTFGFGFSVPFSKRSVDKIRTTVTTIIILLYSILHYVTDQKIKTSSNCHDFFSVKNM